MKKTLESDFTLEDIDASGIAQGFAPGTKVRKYVRKPKRSEHFIKVPMHWFEALAGASVTAHRVALWLLYLHWKGDGMKIKLTTAGLKTVGVGERGKRNALKDLERRKLIQVRRRDGRSPYVKIRAKQ